MQNIDSVYHKYGNHEEAHIREASNFNLNYLQMKWISQIASVWGSKQQLAAHPIVHSILVGFDALFFYSSILTQPFQQNLYL